MLVKSNCAVAEKVHAIACKNVLWRVFLSCAESSVLMRKGGSGNRSANSHPLSVAKWVRISRTIMGNSRLEWFQYARLLWAMGGATPPGDENYLSDKTHFSIFAKCKNRKIEL